MGGKGFRKQKMLNFGNAFKLKKKHKRGKYIFLVIAPLAGFYLFIYIYLFIYLFIYLYFYIYIYIYIYDRLDT